MCFVFASSFTNRGTKYPFCAVSFHSDWTNWDLLTANPIRAGSGQSGRSICHPRHTELPLFPIKAFVFLTSSTFSRGFFFFRILDNLNICPKTGNEICCFLWLKQRLEVEDHRLTLSSKGQVLFRSFSRKFDLHFQTEESFALLNVTEIQTVSEMNVYLL